FCWNAMSRGSKSKPERAHSSLLSLQESDRLEELLGRRCASMATTVAQLFMALPHSPAVWSLQHTGVVCFVKDNLQRSYFIRMFDMKAGRMIWEQELYNQIVYSSPLPFFHTFAADDCQVGLSFAKQQEAEAFQNAVEDKLHQMLTRQEKKHPSSGSFHMATVDIQNPDIHSSRYRSVTTPAAASVATGKGKKDKKDKSKKKGAKLSKADIGAPSGFKHVSHVGWDPNNLDPDLWKLLSQAGISEAEMRDEQTSQLIYNVIEQSGGMEAVKREVNRGGETHAASLCSSLLNWLLPPSGPPPPPPGGDSRGALLDQIRLGKKLRNVILKNESSRVLLQVTDTLDSAPPASLESGEGIVGALMMVMQKRSKAIHSSDESEDEGGDEDEDDDEWDD
uniref:Uncharacterized protein n=1 Tax=Mola mola TaxID=94237 RepID=A0A3Q3X447_MOLML